ncbi:MAG: ABC-type enterobactin transport system permease subunit [Haloarculaceae archaeon]|jgi:ABC-type enterobactin transport system permease subunit
MSTKVYSRRSLTVSTESDIDLARLGRTLILIGFVTAFFLLLSANRLDEDIFSIAAVAIGVVAFITAMVEFFISESEFE